MNLRHQENLSCVRIFHSGPRRKSADIDVISLRWIRTYDYTFLAWDRNSKGHISFCFFRRGGWSPSHSGSKLFFFRRFGWLFECNWRRLGGIWFSGSGSPGGARFSGLLLRRLRLKSIRNWVANFLEKVSYRIGVCRRPTQKQERDDQQGNAARTNQAISWLVGVQCETVIVLEDCALREEDFFCTRGLKWWCSLTI